MSPLNPHLVRHGHSVLRKAAGAVGWRAGFVALSGATVVQHDHAVVGSKAGAHAVPLAVVAGLACQQEQGRASAMALKVQAGAVGGGGEGHGSMGG